MAPLALSSSFAVCEPPGNPTSPRRWGRDCRPIRPRRPASTLTTAEIQKLKDAYAAMRALDTSDPNDPRGFHHQANIHCWYCGHGVQVHFTWQFFVWHRAYLYFHERILGKLIGDLDFRLPYWDWDSSAHRKLPSAYTSPNSSANPLWNGSRSMSPTDEIPDSDVGDTVMDAALNAGTFADFGGSASSSGIPENAPHGSVHVDVGGDMGYFDSAANDPIFYAHHSNVDKMWSDWNKASASHTNPTDTTFLNLSWNFFDENKVWRSITAAQVLDHETQLRYVYGPSLFSETLPCLLKWVIIKFNWQINRPWKIAGPIRTRLNQTIETGGRVRLHVVSMSVPIDKSAIYNLYASPEAAKTDKGPGSPEYIGTFPVVLNMRKDQHDHDHAEHKERPMRDLTFNLSKQATDLLSRAEHAGQLTFVERGVKENNRAPVTVKARDIHFSAAGVSSET